MASADSYRLKAAEMLSEAEAESSPLVRSELENLALAYMRLAAHADRKAQMVSQTPEDAGDKA